MSRWTEERIKKRGLEAFTRAKVEYVFTKEGTPIPELVDTIIDIVHNYHKFKMTRALKRSEQKALFDETLL